MIAVFAHGVSCSSSANNIKHAGVTEQALALGTWGGQHVRAEVNERGADLEFDCAQGNIAGKIMLDSAGGFEVNGSFSTQHAGPIRDDETSSRTVRYKGVVKDNEMELTITDAKNKDEIGSFSLRFGNEGRLMKCR